MEAFLEAYFSFVSKVGEFIGVIAGFLLALAIPLCLLSLIVVGIKKLFLTRSPR